MYIDNKLINSGNLLEDMEPSIIPPKEIIDETDRKPNDWDDREK
jgi:calnexin